MKLLLMLIFSVCVFFVQSLNADSVKTVVLAGTVQGALGGPNWNPSANITKMEYLSDGIYEFIGIFPKGSYEYKVAVGGSWEENYGAGGVERGSNVTLNVLADNTQVRFIFNYHTKLVQDSCNDTISPFKTPKLVEIIGLGKKAELTGEGDILRGIVQLSPGIYEYQVRYDNNPELTYGTRGLKKSAGIRLELKKQCAVEFVHNLTDNITYDSINYIPVTESDVPVLIYDKTRIIMQDKDKDNIFEAAAVLPAGKRQYNFAVVSRYSTVAQHSFFFNEIRESYPVHFSFDYKSGVSRCDYVEHLTKPDGTVEGRSLYYNSRDLNCKKPFGAVSSGTPVWFCLSAKAHDLERARLVVQIQKIIGNQDSEEYSETMKFPMKRTGFSEDLSREYWTVQISLKNIHVYGYYFEAVDGKDTVIYGNNTSVLPVPHTRVIGLGGAGQTHDHDNIVRYTLTVYDPDFKTPDWAQDIVYYYIFPERFKNGDHTNDPVPGVTRYHGNSEIEFHENWADKKPWVPGNSDGHQGDDKLWCNDFYGGDLEGIIQKIKYLKELGVNTLYINPIFEAPSNHKYDTADYLHIDDNFGTNLTFVRLARQCRENGIRIVLDTSLNHSGADSHYMDRYGKYPEYGAFENEKIRNDSPYYDWYEFCEDEKDPSHMYEQWGDASLANLKESDSYKDFAFRDDDSVMKYWIDLGASGWRMDVAPWVSDEFWREWRREIKGKNPEILTVAESWFDSSKYFLGDMFDSTMNYIFRQAVMDFANGKSARESVEALELMRENYPAESFYCLMNLLSTHDAPRALYEFGYTDNASLDEIAVAKKRLLLSVAFQMVFPGSPTVYYGDEAGVTGGDDPFNRAPYPWKEDGGLPDENLIQGFSKLIHIRNQYPVLRRGDIQIYSPGEQCIVIIRRLGKKEAVAVLNSGENQENIHIDRNSSRIFQELKNVFDEHERYKRYPETLNITIPPISAKILVSTR